MTLREAQAWIDLYHAAGAKRIGVSCNPLRRKLYLMADKATHEFDCATRRETRLLKDILHDYIGRLTEKG